LAEVEWSVRLQLYLPSESKKTKTSGEIMNNLNIARIVASPKQSVRRRKWRILVAIALVTLPLARAHALDYVVNTTDDSGNVIACKKGTAGCSLRGAILLANAVSGDDAIFFNLPPGSVIFLTQPLPDISEGVTVSGPGADKLTVLKPGGSSDIYLFNVTTSGTVNFSGLTVGGQAFGDRSQGGGIKNSSSATLYIISCTIRDNVVSSGTTDAKGGGIQNVSGTVNVINSTLNGNSTLGTPFPGFGGGIYNESGTVNVTNSTLINNSSVGGCGGGIYNNDNGTLSITNSTLSGNFAGSDSDGVSGGGGAICNGGTLNVTNSTLSGNGMFNISLSNGSTGGGGILNLSNGPINITNSTISGNAVYGTGSAGGGGGILNIGPGAVNVKTSIIATNTSSTSGPDVFGTFHSQGFNLIGKKDGSTGFTMGTDKKGTIASPLDPKLDPRGLRKNGGPTQTVALVQGSPAIDKGTSNGLTGTLTIDQRDLSRTFDNSSIPNATGGDGTDIGAFEFGAH
jgi:hypothetical protein